MKMQTGRASLITSVHVAPRSKGQDKKSRALEDRALLSRPRNSEHQTVEPARPSFVEWKCRSFLGRCKVGEHETIEPER